MTAAVCSQGSESLPALAAPSSSTYGTGLQQNTLVFPDRYCYLSSPATLSQLDLTSHGPTSFLPSNSHFIHCDPAEKLLCANKTQWRYVSKRAETQT